MSTHPSQWRPRGNADAWRDLGLMLLSAGLVALATLLLVDRVSMTMFATTAAATASTAPPASSTS